MDHRFEHARRNPALGLLIDGIPRRQVAWHHPPGRPGSDQPAQAIEHFAQFMVSLRGIFAHQGQIGATKAHSSSLTSLGVLFRYFETRSCSKLSCPEHRFYSSRMARSGFSMLKSYIYSIYGFYEVLT